MMSAQTLVFRLLKIQSDVPSRIQLQSSDFETILLRDSDESFENSEKNSEDQSESNPSSENSAVEIYSSSSYSGLGETIDMNIGDHFDKQPINQLSDVAPTNLVASLIALVSKHNASDTLLNDLLKRNQVLFGEGAVSPWFVKKQLNDLYSKFISRKLSVDSGEIILIKFRPQLNEIVLNSLSKMLSYSRNKNIAEDIFMPDLQIVDGKIFIRLIVNTDGALVAKSLPSSAWPLFIAVADLPPRKSQAFQNIVLACLYVGKNGYNKLPSSEALELASRERRAIVHHFGCNVRVSQPTVDCAFNRNSEPLSINGMPFPSSKTCVKNGS